MRFSHFILTLGLLALTLNLAAQDVVDTVATTSAEDAGVQQVGEFVRQTRGQLIEAGHELLDQISLNPKEYEREIRQLFRERRWEEGKRLLDMAYREYGKTSTFSYLYGRYCWNDSLPDRARRCCLAALKEDNSNVEALELLVKIEDRQRNYSTAIAHVDELLVFSPYNKRLWRRKIELYRKLHNDVEADRLLERLYTIYPEDEQIKRDLIYQREQSLIEDKGRAAESQIATLEQLIKMDTKNPDHYLALANVLLQQGRMDEAQEVCLKGIMATSGNELLVRKRVGILMDMARYQEAEQYLRQSIREYQMGGMSGLQQYVADESTTAAENQDLYTRYRRRYASNPSRDNLSDLIRFTMSRGYWDDAEEYVMEARRREGDTPELIAKSRLIADRLGKTRLSDRYLEQLHILTPDDQDISDEIAIKRLRQGSDLMQEELYMDALPYLYEADSLSSDSDLIATAQRRIQACYDLTRKDSVVDPFEEYLAYNKAHNWDSAYAALKRYHAGIDEVHEINRLRTNLLARTYKNIIELDYQYARRVTQTTLSHNAFINYTHLWDKDALTVSAAYAGRETGVWVEHVTDSRDSTFIEGGGTGVQLGAGYTHTFQWGSIEVSGAWGSKFYPKGQAKLTFTEELPRDFTLTERLAWRYIANEEPKYHLWTLGLSTTWNLNGFYLTPALDLYLMQKRVYASGGLKLQYFPLDGDRSFIFTQVGVGNAPETELLDKTIALDLGNLNTNVSVGGQYVITSHLTMGATASWFVIGSNNNIIRNYLYINIDAIIRF